MAYDRTNMVSLLDIGKLMSETSKIVKLGSGFTELSEDWAPNIESTQYIDQTSKSSTMKGYEFSMSPEREFLSDEVQECINYMAKHFPTGNQCESFYYRFFKTDIKGNEGECIKVPVIVAFSSAGGAGGDTLTTSIQINGNGDTVLGTITINTETGEYTFTEKPEENV